MRNILFISFWVPPVVRPQSILVGKMLPYWKENGLNPIIASYSNLDTLEGQFRNYSIPRIRGGINTVKGRTLRKLQLYFQYLRLKKICEKHNVEAIFAFANPQECNVLGGMLAMNLGIPFISHFSDPYLHNPYKTHNKNTEEYIKKEEAFIIRQSFKAIVTNIEALKLISKPYKEDSSKFAVIPHCFEEKLYPQIITENADFVISHIGAFYKQRSPEIFFQALHYLERHHSDKLKNVKVKCVGGLNAYAGFSQEEFDSLVKKYSLNTFVELVPPVDFIESLALMKKSSCLLLIDADLENSPFLPSKLIDYIGARRPVLSYTPRNSPTDVVLQSLGIPSFKYDQIKESAEYLIQLIDKKVSINWEQIDSFSARNTQRMLTDIIKQEIVRNLKN